MRSKHRVSASIMWRRRSSLRQWRTRSAISRSSSRWVTALAGRLAAAVGAAWTFARWRKHDEIDDVFRFGHWFWVERWIELALGLTGLVAGTANHGVEVRWTRILSEGATEAFTYGLGGEQDEFIQRRASSRFHG